MRINLIGEGGKMGDYPAVATKAQQVKDLEDLLIAMTTSTVEKILVYYGENTPYETTEALTMSDMVTTLRSDLTDEKNTLVAEIKVLADC